MAWEICSISFFMKIVLFNQFFKSWCNSILCYKGRKWAIFIECKVTRAPGEKLHGHSMQNCTSWNRISLRTAYLRYLSHDFSWKGCIRIHTMARAKLFLINWRTFRLKIIVRYNLKKRKKILKHKIRTKKSLIKKKHFEKKCWKKNV